MSQVLDSKDVVEDIVTSYEARIQSIASIFDTTHQIFEGFQDYFLDTRQEREKINAELRENLARNESLRRKDFDNMMNNILSSQTRREKEVRNLLKDYFSDQETMAKALRENLGKFKDPLTRREDKRVKEFQAFIREILAEQEERKKEVASKLKEFQKEQQEMAKRLKELLAKGRELHIRDLKLMLKELKFQHKERLVRREERRDEVRHLLSGFKKERTEAARKYKGQEIKR